MQVGGGDRGHPEAVQALRGAEGEGGGEFEGPLARDLGDLGGAEPALAADRDGPLDLGGDDDVQRGREVLDVAELPAGCAALDRQQARRLEVAGDDGVDAGPGERGGADDGDVQPGVGGGRGRGQLLHLQEVAGDAGVGLGEQRRVLGERELVAGRGAVHHRRRDEDHTAYPGGSGGGHHGLGAADVVGAAVAGGGVRGVLDVQVDEHVHVGEPAGQQRVPDVHDTPDDPGHVAAMRVDGDDLADLFPFGEPGGEQPPRPGGRAGDGDDRALATPRANLARYHGGAPFLVYATLP
ncbi:hypothetical protein GCM10010208_51760 [Actinomadura livida]|nr:hypothetical protein GCM10010208_51760 [Actinomadura livida]